MEPENNQSENIFDLHAIIPETKEIETSTKSTLITEQDRAGLLANYEEVPREQWTDLPIKIHIRYLRKDGTFRRGGFVKNIWASVNKAGTEVFQMSSSLSYNSKTWRVPFSSISKVWKSKKFNKTADVEKIAKSTTTNTEQIEYLTKSVEQLRIDLTKLSNEQARIVKLIRKLHPY